MASGEFLREPFQGKLSQEEQEEVLVGGGEVHPPEECLGLEEVDHDLGQTLIHREVLGVLQEVSRRVQGV